MRALVTGATGFLGLWLVRQLLERGYQVRALVRPESPLGALAGLGIEEARGDVTLPESLPAAVGGCDLVFHLAGIRRAPKRDVFLKVNAAGTRALLEACLRGAPGMKRFVLAGSITAAGPSATGVSEEEPLRPVEWYGESKAEAERIAFSYRDRLPVTVARPPRITGPGDRENLLFFRLAARRVVLALSGPPRPLSFVDVQDCARGFLLLAEREEAVGEPFFLASDERTDLEGLQREAARALGVEPRRVTVPPWLLRTAGRAADAASLLLRRHLPMNRKLAEQILAPGWTCRTEKARRRLEFEARTSLRESISRSALWYREKGWI
ncbi:MAG TPA: NAD-dependent epimerase/dehydratase family protein [Anaeromyxobacteraceae bacterium]|nr:NAD-dependent epimerase/dehydratase family protein [Anaeromyxobacteraceae bacterium]